MVIQGQVVKFKRPNSDIIEEGVVIGYYDRHVIIDKDLNVVINCSYEQWIGEEISFVLN